MMNEKKQLHDETENEAQKGPIIARMSLTAQQMVLLVGSFVIIFIALHFLFPVFSSFDVNLLPESIHLLNLIQIRGDYFFGLILSAGLSFLLTFHLQLLKKIVKVFVLLGLSFIALFITLHFILPGIPSTALEAFPETVYLFDFAIQSSFFFSFIIAVLAAILLVFHPNKLKAFVKFMFSFWGFKVVLSLVDILIFRNLLRASDADQFTMWTIPLLFAFLTNFLPFFFAVAFKTHQEGFEDKQEASRKRKTSRLRQKFFATHEVEDNRMKRASYLFLWGTILILLATAWLITNQRWIQMNQSLHASLAHFEDMGPHTILIDGVHFYIENPPLDELPTFAVMQDFWHLNDSGLPIYGRYQQFLIDFTLLILPILLIFVTILASYFNVSDRITNKWYQILEEITDRKKKKMRFALQEFEAAKERYESSKFEYEQGIAQRNSQMRKLQVLIGISEQDVINDVAIFEKTCRDTIRKNSIRSALNSYDTHLNNLHAWILSDLELFKSKMATNHEEVAIQHTVLTIDLNEMIKAYNETVEPIKQFDTTEKVEALMSRLKMMNNVDEDRGD